MRAILLVCPLVCCLVVGAFAQDGDDSPLQLGRFNWVDGFWSAHIHPEVQSAMADIFASERYGTNHSESSFIVHGYRPDLTPIIRRVPTIAARELDRFEVIAGDTAIVHTHPDKDDPRPSEEDMNIATKYHFDMYTVTSRGVFLYRKGMEVPMLVIDRDTFLNIVKARQKEKTASRHRATPWATPHDVE